MISIYIWLLISVDAKFQRRCGVPKVPNLSPSIPRWNKFAFNRIRLKFLMNGRYLSISRIEFKSATTTDIMNSNEILTRVISPSIALVVICMRCLRGVPLFSDSTVFVRVCHWPDVVPARSGTFPAALRRRSSPACSPHAWPQLQSAMSMRSAPFSRQNAQSSEQHHTMRSRIQSHQTPD